LNEFLKVSGSHCENVTDIGAACVCWTDRVFSVCQCYVAVCKQIKDDFDFGIESMHIPWLMVHGIDDEANAFEPD
jgi:hypothetical protein